MNHKNDGSPEHPIQMHFVSYSELVRKFMDAVDVSDKDGICVMALLLGAVRAERFCDRALLGFSKKGVYRGGWSA